MKFKFSHSTKKGRGNLLLSRLRPVGKTILVMKLTTLLLLTALLQTKANAYSQQITLRVKNTPLDKVCAQISRQSGYHFFFNERLVKDARKVSLDLQGVSLQQALDACFSGQPFNYIIVDNTVVVRKKSDPPPLMHLAASPLVLVVKGRVTNEKGEPLPGASVKLKNSTKGATSDAKGEFNFTVPDGTTVELEITMLGFKTQAMTPSDPANVVIVLKEEATTLDNLVVIGYGTTRRQDFTGSVASVKMEGSPIASLPNMNILEALKGNVSGLSVGAANTAGGQPSMMIRGQNSISGNNDPLIVLDGVVFLGSIGDINPNDIASVDVLKDATSAAAYGSRSANGVIAITTKKGRVGKPVISFNTSTGFQKWQNQPVMMTGKEWIDVVNARNKYTPGSTNWLKPGEIANMNAGRETVWLDEVTRTGLIQSYQAAVSGATQQTNYYISSSFDQNKGIVKGDDFKRVSVLAKLNMNITSWLEIGADGAYTKRDYSGFAANVGEAQTMSPYGVMYRDSLGHLEKYPYTQSAINPLWGVQDGTRNNMDVGNNFRLNAHALVRVPWVDGLTYRSNLMLNLDKDRTGNFYNEKYFVAEGEGLARYSPATIQGFLSRANGNIENYSKYSYVIDNILSYKKTFGKHSVDVTGVYTRDYWKEEWDNSSGSDFQANGNTALGMFGLQTATVQKATVNIVERANIGYLGRLSYAYNNRYFVTGSYRRDGASVFGANNKWADFAAAGLAWRITEEDFMKNLHYLNNLKLKVSWGQNGNQGVGPYGTLSRVSNGSSGGVRYEFSNSASQIFYGLYQNSLGNSDLGWETTESWNAGFESSWFNDRLFVDLDMYKSKTTDQIFTRNIPVMTGFKTMQTSMGQVDNKGIEITVRSVNIKQADWGWTTAVTFWQNRNKLVKLYGEDKNGDGKEDDDIANNLFIGHSLGVIYGYEQTGIVQVEDTAYMRITGAAAGAPMYRDLDKVQGISAADRKILGYTPDNFRLSMSNTVNYKNFDLYVMISGNFGGNGYYLKSNSAAYLTSGTGRFNDNMTSKPYWTEQNRSNTYPSAFFSGDGRFLGLQNRTFVRLQDVTLSYRLKQSLLTPLRINSAKFFLTAKNLATFTDWFGGDPETGTPVRENTFPVPSTYSFGANISF